jgi:hypothetical protein
MKHTFIKSIASAFVIAFFVSSCSMTNHSMKEPNNHVEFVKADFTLSEQVSAEASSTRICGIDLARLFSKTTGTVVKESLSPIPSVASIPVIGTVLTDPTSSYALYELMSKNTGYDVVFYPQFAKVTKCPLGIPIITKSTVKVTARLGKLK